MDLGPLGRGAGAVAPEPSALGGLCHRLDGLGAPADRADLDATGRECKCRPQGAIGLGIHIDRPFPLEAL